MKNTYQKVIQKTRFRNTSKLQNSTSKLERSLQQMFGEEYVGPKRIGSSITGTMRRNDQDLDYFIEFESPPDEENIEQTLTQSHLDMDHVTHDNHGYSRFTGFLKDYEFVLVPMQEFTPPVESYPEDAYHHPAFIADRKHHEHEEQVLLAKEFFKQSGFYKDIKGIGCELLTLKFGSFEEVLSKLQEKDSIRINYSPHDQKYTDSNIVIDYPFLGKRSLTNYIGDAEYQNLRDYAATIERSPDMLLKNLTIP